MEPSLKDDLIQDAIHEYNRRLQLQFPLELRHFCEYSEEGKITSAANEIKPQLLEEFKQQITFLSLDGIPELVQELRQKLEEVTNELVAKNKANQTRAETFVKNEVDTLLQGLKTSVEAKLSMMNPPGTGTDQNQTSASIRQTLEQEKTLTFLMLENRWRDVNPGLYEMSKKRLEEGLEELLKKHCSPPPTWTSTSTTTAAATATTSSGKVYPLIFWLTSDLIFAGTRVGDTFQKLDVSISPAIAVDDNGNLVCGDEALERDHYWSLEKCIADSGSPTPISFNLAGQLVTQEVNLEFLLGLLLRSMKNSAEEELPGRRFTTAVILIPIWLCSRHRVQIRDATYVAGFTETYLFNQETITAYAHLSKRLNKKLEILVLSENLGVLSAISYRNAAYALGHIHMISDDYWTIPKDSKDLADPNKRSDVIKSLTTSFRCRSDRIVGAEEVILFLTTSESSEWMEDFKKFAKNGFAASKEEIFELFLFWGTNMEGMLKCFKEYTSSRLLPCRYYDPSKKDTFANLISKNQMEAYKQCEIPMMKLFPQDQGGGVSKVLVFQENIRSEEMVAFGELEFIGASKYTEEYIMNALKRKLVLLLTFNVSLRDATLAIKKVEAVDEETFKPEDFKWNMICMSDVAKEDLKTMVNFILEEEE